MAGLRLKPPPLPARGPEAEPLPVRPLPRAIRARQGWQSPESKRLGCFGGAKPTLPPRRWALRTVSGGPAPQDAHRAGRHSLPPDHSPRLPALQACLSRALKRGCFLRPGSLAAPRPSFQEGASRRRQRGPCSRPVARATGTSLSRDCGHLTSRSQSHVAPRRSTLRSSTWLGNCWTTTELGMKPDGTLGSSKLSESWQGRAKCSETAPPPRPPSKGQAGEVRTQHVWTGKGGLGWRHP